MSLESNNQQQLRATTDDSKSIAAAAKTVGGSDQQDEVRKLQDLVRKLELQNEQLRVKQTQILKQHGASRETTPTSGRGRTSSVSPPPPLNTNFVAEVDRMPADAAGVVTNGNNNDVDSVLDEVELIDVDKLDLSDEDSWLFSSPHLSAEQRAVNPYLWLRMDVEDPGNSELQSVKKALVSKIEELARVSNLYASPVQYLAARRCQPLPLDASEQQQQRLRVSPNCKLALGPSLQRDFDSRTFTRPKKSPRSLELPVVDGCDLSPIAHQPPREEIRLRGSCTPPLNDVIDIHTLARLQEENLRQCSPPSTPRRNSVASSSSQRSAVSPVLPSDQEAQEWVGANGTFASTGSESMVEGSPQAQSSRGSSTSASPSVSPRGSQYFEEGRNSSGIAKRVMPPPRLYNGVYASRGGGMNNHHPHHPMQRIPKSPGNHHEQSNHVPEQVPRVLRYSASPVRQPSSGSGTPRSSSPATRYSSIPVRNSPPISEDEIQTKPVNHSSRIPKPRTRSAIPMLQRSRASNNYEDSWKEGCF